LGPLAITLARPKRTNEILAPDLRGDLLEERPDPDPGHQHDDVKPARRKLARERPGRLVLGDRDLAHGRRLDGHAPVPLDERGHLRRSAALEAHDAPPAEPFFAHPEVSFCGAAGPRGRDSPGKKLRPKAASAALITESSRNDFGCPGSLLKLCL
jgi:hypothetical protein